MEFWSCIIYLAAGYKGCMALVIQNDDHHVLVVTPKWLSLTWNSWDRCREKISCWVTRKIWHLKWRYKDYIRTVQLWDFYKLLLKPLVQSVQLLSQVWLLLPSIFPSIRVFPMSQFFASGGQNIGVSASASVLPMNIQDWFPLGWTGWISLQSKGLSRVFSNTTVQKHQFFGAQLAL